MSENDKAADPGDGLGDDALLGVKAIAAYRGEPERRTRHLIALGLIPVGREGGKYRASKRQLRRDAAAKTAPKAATTPES